MGLYIFCDEIGSDWGIVLTPQAPEGLPPAFFKEFEAALEALVHRLNDGLARLGEPGRVRLNRTEDESE